MKKKEISDFLEFQCEAATLSLIRGGGGAEGCDEDIDLSSPDIEELFDSGAGITGDICGIGMYGEDTNCCVNETLIMYHDGSWEHWWCPCD